MLLSSDGSDELVANTHILLDADKAVAIDLADDEQGLFESVSVGEETCELHQLSLTNSSLGVA